MIPFLFAPYLITRAATVAALRATADAMEGIDSRSSMFPSPFGPYLIPMAVTDAWLKATALWLEASCRGLTSVGPSRPDLSDMSSRDLRELIDRLESELSKRPSEGRLLKYR